LVRVALSAAAVAALVAVPACRNGSGSTDSSTVTVVRAAKTMPVGMLVASARSDGTLVVTQVPAGDAPPDHLESLDGLNCMVAATSLPLGTVLRQSQIVAPSALGLSRGIVPGTATDGGC
jgi:hypothetical protein